MSEGFRAHFSDAGNGVRLCVEHSWDFSREVAGVAHSRPEVSACLARIVDGVNATTIDDRDDMLVALLLCMVYLTDRKHSDGFDAHRMAAALERLEQGMDDPL